METDIEAIEGWRPIATAPKDWLRAGVGHCLVGSWRIGRDEDGELTGDDDWAWAHVATLSHDGWHVWSKGFAGLHGMATFPLHGNATHWQPIPPPSAPI